MGPGLGRCDGEGGGSWFVGGRGGFLLSGEGQSDDASDSGAVRARMRSHLSATECNFPASIEHERSFRASRRRFKVHPGIGAMSETKQGRCRVRRELVSACTWNLSCRSRGCVPCKGQRELKDRRAAHHTSHHRRCGQTRGFLCFETNHLVTSGLTCLSSPDRSHA